MPRYLKLSALLAIALMTAWAGWHGLRAYMLRVPEPATASKEGIVRWLLLRDLGEEPEETRRQLVARIEELFSDSFDVSAAGQLDPGDIDRLRQNAEVLKESWFHAKVDEYYSCGEAVRGPYLDRQIQTVARWAELDEGLDVAAAAEGVARTHIDFGERLTGFFNQLDEWTRRAGPHKYQRIRSVVKAALIRWFARQDFVDESATSKLRLVRGLEQQLGGHLELAGTTSGMSAAEQATFWRNVDSLAESWFRDKAREHALLETSKRPAFVSRQAEVVEQLSGQQRAATVPVARRIEQWIAASPPDERRRLREFAQALQASVAVRKLKSWFKDSLNPAGTRS